MEKEFINGMYLSYQNAKNLYEEAQILEKYKKAGRSYCLYHLSLEECGRFHLIYNCFTEYILGEITAKEFNYGTLKKRGYEDHQLKIKKNFEGVYKTIYTILAITNSDELEQEMGELTKVFEAIIEIQGELNDLKNESLYITYKNNKFNLPDNSIMASDYLRIKKMTCLSLKAIERITEFFEAKGGFDKLRENIKQSV